MVATDSYRLAVRDLVATADGEGKAIVPERALTEAGRAAAADEKGSIEIFVDESPGGVPDRRAHADVAADRGRVPELPPAAAGDSTRAASRSRASSCSMPCAAWACWPATPRPVRIEFNALGVKLSSSSPDLGQAVETVEARYEGEDLTVAFNPQYLADGLTAATGESIRLDVRDGLKPGVVRGDGRRVHVPGDAGASAGGGQLGKRLRRKASPDAPRLGRAA